MESATSVPSAAIASPPLPFAAGKPVFVTGAAGFIGYHLCLRLLRMGVAVVGIDSITDYYDTKLKMDRVKSLQEEARTIHREFTFVKGDIADASVMTSVFDRHAFDIVVNLAAQAGVRYSLHNPHSYVHANLDGFCQVLEQCRHHHVKHLVYASSSSVYGGNTKTPFSESDNVDHPVSLYAASKKANELMAHSYAHLFGIPCTGLRFFTVYGPWGRPDMAVASFTKNIFSGAPIELFNHGDMKRDFTYVDDIVEGVVRVMQVPPTPQAQYDTANPDPSTSFAPYRVLNIGNSCPVDLLTFVATLERIIGRKANTVLKPMQPGDVYATAADVSRLDKLVGFAPSTPLEAGLQHYVEWFRAYYKPAQ